ncbi:hypothetical protein [Novipirellula caenicola]|uniref:Uncharacterized protein n=1 Tax=Novipirellula caenicola TaxID=1536901 RepID=A0ABP9VK83_9BACT
MSGEVTPHSSKRGLSRLVFASHLRFAVYVAAWFPAWLIVAIATPRSEGAFDALRQRGELFISAEWLLQVAPTNVMSSLLPSLALLALLILTDLAIERTTRSSERASIFLLWGCGVVLTGIVTALFSGMILSVTIQRAGLYP